MKKKNSKELEELFGIKENRINSYFVLGIIIALGIFSLVMFALMLLWNWLIPTIFGLPTITFWQTVGMWLLITFFFTLFNKRG